MADLADIQLISKLNKIITFLLCLIDIFSKCASVIPLKRKKRCSHCQCITKYFKQFRKKTEQNKDRKRQ